MNFNTLKQELHKKIKNMSKEDFINFIEELKRIYDKVHPYERPEDREVGFFINWENVSRKRTKGVEQ